MNICGATRGSFRYHVCVDGECVPFDNYACPIVGQYKTTDIMEFPDIGTPMPGPCNGKVCTACEWCHDVSRCTPLGEPP